MAYLGTKELKALLPSCIDQFDEKRIANVAYELCLGDEVYLTDSSSGKKEILDAKNSQVVLKPGQFALLLTMETIKIPDNILAFISIKFSLKIKGLVNISGFHVDPGFEGKIIFSVYNAGPTVIRLDKGKPYFLIWFSHLTSISDPYEGRHQKQTEITAEHINSLSGELASPNMLLERIKSNESLLKNCIWAAGIVIGIGLTISFKSCFDMSKFNEGYYVGLKERSLKNNIDSIVANNKIDSIVTKKIDSILQNKINTNDSSKNKQ